MATGEKGLPDAVRRSDSSMRKKNAALKVNAPKIANEAVVPMIRGLKKISAPLDEYLPVYCVQGDFDCGPIGRSGITHESTSHCLFLYEHTE